jgi:hypothetical protein
VDLDDELYERLTKARFRDHISNADRIRALLVLALEDDAIAARTLQRASELAEERASQT